MRKRDRQRHEGHGEPRRGPSDPRYRGGSEERSRFADDERGFGPPPARQPSYDPERDRYAAQRGGGGEDEFRRQRAAYEPWRLSREGRDYASDRWHRGEYSGSGSYGNRDFGWYGGGGQAQDVGSGFGEREGYERPGASGYPSYGLEERWEGPAEPRPRVQGGFAGRGPRGYKRSDERIREDVCDRLMLDPQVDASGIDVRVADGQVTLEGTIDNRRAKHRAEDLCESISGVQDVANHLRIKREPVQTYEQSSGSSTGTNAGTSGNAERRSPGNPARS